MKYLKKRFAFIKLISSLVLIFCASCSSPANQCIPKDTNQINPTIPFGTIINSIVSGTQTKIFGNISGAHLNMEGSLVKKSVQSIITNRLFSTVAILAIALYFVIFGLRLVLGFENLDVKNITKQMIRLIIFTTFTTMGGFEIYTKIIVEPLVLGIDYINKTTISTFFHTTASSMNSFDIMDYTIGKVFSLEGLNKILGLFFTGFYGWLNCIVILYAFVLVLIVNVKAVIIYLANIAIIGGILIIFPLFGILKTFDRTEEFFDKGIKQLVDLFIEQYMLFTLIVLMNILIGVMLDNLLYYEVCWSDVFGVDFMIPMPSWVSDIVNGAIRTINDILAAIPFIPDDVRIPEIAFPEYILNLRLPIFFFWSFTTSPLNVPPDIFSTASLVIIVYYYNNALTYLIQTFASSAGGGGMSATDKIMKTFDQIGVDGAGKLMKSAIKEMPAQFAQSGQRVSRGLGVAGNKLKEWGTAKAEDSKLTAALRKVSSGLGSTASGISSIVKKTDPWTGFGKLGDDTLIDKLGTKKSKSLQEKIDYHKNFKLVHNVEKNLLNEHRDKLESGEMSFQEFDEIRKDTIRDTLSASGFTNRTELNASNEEVQAIGMTEGEMNDFFEQYGDKDQLSLTGGDNARVLGMKAKVDDQIGISSPSETKWYKKFANKLSRMKKSKKMSTDTTSYAKFAEQIAGINSAAHKAQLDNASSTIQETEETLSNVSDFMEHKESDTEEEKDKKTSQKRQFINTVAERQPEVQEAQKKFNEDNKKLSKSRQTLDSARAKKSNLHQVKSPEEKEKIIQEFTNATEDHKIAEIQRNNSKNTLQETKDRVRTRITNVLENNYATLKSEQESWDNMIEQQKDENRSAFDKLSPAQVKRKINKVEGLRGELDNLIKDYGAITGEMSVSDEELMDDEYSEDMDESTN